MPVPDLKAYLCAPDEAARIEIVSAHLDRMQNQLQRTHDAITELRALLAPVPLPVRIEVREVARQDAIAITETVPLGGLVQWWQAATSDLAATLSAADVIVSGPLGACFDHALFADEEGEATVWFPVQRSVSGSGRARMSEIPGGWFAIALHEGPDHRIDETYAVLGTYVGERAIGVGGPVRERYLAGVLDDPAPLITEISWPVAAAAG
jgi:effector-binding domain-containing protein